VIATDTPQLIPQGVEYIRILPELVLTIFGMLIMLLDPLVDEQPSAGAVALDVAGAAAGAGEGELLLVGREHGEQGRTVVAVGVAAGVHPGSEDRHEGEW